MQIFLNKERYIKSQKFLKFKTHLDAYVEAAIIWIADYIKSHNLFSIYVVILWKKARVYGLMVVFGWNL